MYGFACNGIKYMQDDDGSLTVTGTIGSPLALAIPSHVGECPVVGIADYAFYQQYLLAWVEIPPTVAHIGDHAFAGTKLGHVNIPEGVESLGLGTFAQCRQLLSATVPSTVAVLPDEVFQGCCRLTCVCISHGVESIGSSAFAGCLSLRKVVLPRSVKHVGEQAFACCKSLEEACLPCGPVELEEGTFVQSGLKHITIPNGTKAIPACAFSGCQSLREVSLGSGVMAIGKRALKGCTSLRTISLPIDVMFIGDEAFYGCGALCSVYLRRGIVSIGQDAFRWCSQKLSIHCESDCYAWERCNDMGLRVDRLQEASSTHPLDKVGESVILVGDHGGVEEYRVLKRFSLGEAEYALMVPLGEELHGPTIDVEVHRVRRHNEEVCIYEPVVDAAECTAVSDLVYSMKPDADLPGEIDGLSFAESIGISRER